jgi:hypothetical protein
MDGALVGAGAAGAAAMALVAAAIALVAIMFVSCARSDVTLDAVVAIKAIVKRIRFMVFL